MSNKNILVTGTSRGIGQAIAKTFLEEGYSVIGTSTTGKSNIEDENFSCYQLSLDNEESIKSFIEELNKNKVSLQGIINNAAILLDKNSSSQVDIEKLRTTFNVNFFGAISITEGLIPLLEDNSHIINISSTWGSFSDPYFSEYQPHYKMSKAALNMYTKLLAERLTNRNIKVSALDPGWVKTGMGGMNALKKPSSVGIEVYNLFTTQEPTGSFWAGGRVKDW